jgi:formamidopyrimidine-DNA glycosylase
MPELPEVETIRRDLEGLITGRRITGVTIAPEYGKPVPVLKAIDEATFREGVVGARIEAVERRGKYLAMRLDTGALIVVHLRMTGVLLHRRPDTPLERFLRLTLHLDDGHELRFTDMRKFGGFWLLDDFADASKTGLGPEPLSDDFTAAVLAVALANRKAPVKSILLDQKHIAGIGNIYADEACYAACIDPRRLGADVKPDEVVMLHQAVRDVLQFGVESRGASFKDYKDVAGEQGSMHMHVKVFRRTGKPCYTCDTLIERVKLGGRSTHFCPQCQR